jgi:hypothetical protein
VPLIDESDIYPDDVIFYGGLSATLHLFFM